MQNKKDFLEMEQIKSLYELSKISESKVIGIICFYMNKQAEIFEKLSSNMFLNSLNKTAFECAVDLYKENKCIDGSTLMVECLKKNDKYDVTSFLQIITEIDTTQSLNYHIDQIIDNYKKIQLYMLKNEIDTNQSNEEITSKIQTKIDTLNNLTAQSKFVNLSSAFNDVMEDINSIKLNVNKSYLKSGITFLDETLFIMKKDLTILAARPRMGKTALSLQLAYNYSKNHNVAIFSLEMTKEKLLKRMLSNVSGVSLKKMYTGNVTDNDWKIIINEVRDIEKKNILINDKSGLSLEELINQIKWLKQDKKIDVVFIDHIGLIKLKTSYRSQSTTDMIGELTSQLFITAKNYDISIIALSQLNRECEKRPNKEPILSDLRSSGSLEQDARNVVFLHRDSIYNKGGEVDVEGTMVDNENIAKIIIAKQGDGCEGDVFLKFQGEVQRYSNLNFNEIY